MKAAWGCAALALLSACDRGGDGGPRDPRAAMRRWARCSFDGAGDEPDAARLEAAMRLALRVERERFALRAGRCEESLRVSGAVPPCLSPLRERWSHMLTIAQRPVVDPIDLDVSVRRVGRAWGESLARCPR